MKHADVEVVSRDPQTFSSALGGITIGTPREELLDLGRGILSNMDPPEHTKLRRIVSRVFTPNAVSKQQAHIRRLAQRAVRDVSRRRSCEFVTQVAAVLPLRVICEMMGVPHQDRHHLFELSNQVVAFDDPDLNDGAADKRAFAEIFRYALDLAKTYDGSDEENLTTLLLRAEVDGERLSEFELASFFLLLIMAGNETTRNVLTHAMRLMIENPDQWERLKKDRSLVISAVEEVARCEPGVLSFRRTATRDVTLRGAPIRAGDKVVMWYPSANRDEEVFAIRSASTSRVTRTRTSPSASASTSAWARTWRGCSSASCWRPSWTTFGRHASRVRSSGRARTW